MHVAHKTAQLAMDSRGGGGISLPVFSHGCVIGTHQLYRYGREQGWIQEFYTWGGGTTTKSNPVFLCNKKGFNQPEHA